MRTLVNQTAARISMISAGTFIALLALLHVLEPEFSPSWRMVSEYSNGLYGWLMRLAFLVLAIGNASGFVALKPYVQTRRGKVGLALWLVGIVGACMAAMFDIDSITVTQGQTTQHGNLHGLASLLSVPTFPIVALFVAGSLKRNRTWAAVWQPVRWATHLTWISLLVMLGTLATTLPKAGGFGPNVPIGWPNRLLVVAYCSWLITLARSVLKLSEVKS